MRLIFLFLLIITFYSCENEDPAAIEIFSTEVFAFDIGDYWEVNASTRVKGFAQIEGENNFSATIAYDIDLITPSSDTLKALVSRVEDKTSTERIIDIPLEAQFELDSTYSNGIYTLIFNVKDALTDRIVTTSADFHLGEE